MDHSAANKELSVIMGPPGGETDLPLHDAVRLMWWLPDEERYFRGPPLGRGGQSRLKVVGFERVTLGELLGAAV